MARFFDPISQEWREFHTDIGRGVQRRIEGEPAAEPEAVTPSAMWQWAQSMAPTTPNPVITSGPGVDTLKDILKRPTVKADDGWIEHDGKGMPVAPEAYVYVRFRDGATDEDVDEPWRARCWAECWNHQRDNSNPTCDIVAYKVVSQ